MMILISLKKIILKLLHYMIIKINSNKIKQYHISNLKKFNLNNKISNNHYIIRVNSNNKVKNNTKHHNFTQKSINLKFKNNLVVSCMINLNKININPLSYIKMILNSLLQLIKHLNIQTAYKNNLTRLLLFIQMICSTHLNNNPNKDIKLLNYIQIKINNQFKLNNNNLKLHLYIRMIIDSHQRNLILINHNISRHNNINKILIIKQALINIKQAVN